MRHEKTVLNMSKRVEDQLGLRDTHAHAWQALSYDEGRDHGYAEHTDCHAGSDLFNTEERVATLLLYLSDDFDGGETEFVKLGLRLRPRGLRLHL